MSKNTVFEINSEDETLPEAVPRFAVSKGMLVVKTVPVASATPEAKPINSGLKTDTPGADGAKAAKAAATPPAATPAVSAAAQGTSAESAAAAKRTGLVSPSADGQAGADAAAAEPSAAAASPAPKKRAVGKRKVATPTAAASVPTAAAAPEQPTAEESRPCPKCARSLVWSDSAEGIYEEFGWGCENIDTCHAEQSTHGAFRWFCSPCETDFCQACFLKLPAPHMGADPDGTKQQAPAPADEGMQVDSAAVGSAGDTVVGDAKAASIAPAAKRRGRQPKKDTAQDSPAKGPSEAATPRKEGDTPKKGRQGSAPRGDALPAGDSGGPARLRAKGEAKQDGNSSAAGKEGRGNGDAEKQPEPASPAKTAGEARSDGQSASLAKTDPAHRQANASSGRTPSKANSSGAIGSAFSRQANRSFAQGEVCSLDSDEEDGAMDTSTTLAAPVKTDTPTPEKPPNAAAKLFGKRAAPAEKLASTSTNGSDSSMPPAKRAAKDKVSPAKASVPSGDKSAMEEPLAAAAGPGGKKRQQPAPESSIGSAKEGGSAPSKKDLGHAMCIDQLVQSARSHIRKRDFERAEHVVGVMRDYCKKHGVQLPESLDGSRAAGAARREEDTAAVDVTDADEAIKGTPEEVARDALNRCFPLKHPDLVPPLENEDEVRRQAKKVGSRSKAAEEPGSTAISEFEDGQKAATAKFACIPEAPNEDYERLHAVGSAFRSYVLKGGGNQEKAGKHLESFYQLFQLDDKSFDGMSSPEYVALARSEDAAHGEAAAAFAAFWQAASAADISETAPRLPTNEERNLAAESGVPPGWRVRIFHRVKREDLVILTGPDGTHEYTTKQGLRNMAETVGEFADERRKAEEAGVTIEEARLQAAASLERRRRFAQERLSYLARDAQAREDSRLRLEAAFVAAAGGKAEGVALRGMPSDCNGTFLRLDELFEGFAAYERLGSPQRVFLFRSGSRWIAAPAMEKDSQPLAYIEDASADLPHQPDCDKISWMVPSDMSDGDEFVESTGLAWCQELDHEKLSSRLFSLLHRYTHSECSVCHSTFKDDGAGDEVDDLQDVKAAGWSSYDDVPDATEEERALYPAILEKFDEEGYPYLTGVRKLMALYGKSPAAMGTKSFHALVRQDPVNAICNGFDSSAILYFIIFWEKFSSFNFVPPERKTDAQLIQMESKERKAYLGARKKYEVDPNSAYEVKEQGAVLQDLQIDMPLNRLIADVTSNWKKDLGEFLTETGFLQEDADASGLLATKCGADLLPEPTEKEWYTWGGVLRAFDDWGRDGGRKVMVANPNVDPLRRAVLVHGKAPAVVGSDRYATVVGWEFGRDSPEYHAAVSFAEFWAAKGDAPMPDPAKGLLFKSAVPERWRLPTLAQVSRLKSKRRSLQLPARWELALEPRFLAKEPADQGDRVFTDEGSLRTMLMEQLEERRREQQRKNAVAQDWRLPPRFEVEFQEDDTPYVVGPDGAQYFSPEDVPRPAFMEEGRRSDASGKPKPTARTVELRNQMTNAALRYDFAEAARLRAQLTALEEDPRLQKAVNKVARDEAAAAGSNAAAAQAAAEAEEAAKDDAMSADEGGADAEEPGKLAKEGIISRARVCRAGTMPIVKKKDAVQTQSNSKQVKYTKSAGIGQQQEKQIEVGELMLKAHCWRLKGIRTADGGLLSVEECTELDPASVICVFAQIADEIIPEEQKRIRRLWGLDDDWSVQVRIRLSGNQITVQSPEGRRCSKKNQIQEQARLDAEKKRRAVEAQRLEEARKAIKEAAPQGFQATSNAVSAVLRGFPPRPCRICRLAEQQKGPKDGTHAKQHVSTAVKQAEYESTLRSLDARRADAPRSLGSMTEHMLGRLQTEAPECFEAVRAWWRESSRGGKLRLGTLCSGTDSPAIVLNHLAAILGKISGGRSFGFEHVFSCEMDAEKQEFLMSNFDFEYLFADCTQMGRARAWDVKSQSVQDVPGDIDILAAGFSCKDLSFMNSYRKTLEEMGQSGATLRGCFDYVERYRPRLVLLENVYAIDRADQHGLKQVNIVMEGLRARGYAAAYNLCNSCDYYVPQVRHRIWMWGVRLEERQPQPDAVESTVERATAAGLAVAPQVRQLLRMLEEPSALHFDDFMLPDDDPRVQDFIRQMCAKGCRQREKGKATENRANKRHENSKLTWQQKYSLHRSKLDYAQERPYTSERGARWKMMLNDRLLELLDLKCLDVMNDQSKDPREFPMLWDLLQSVERVPGSRVRRDRQNYAQCLLPPSLLWHTVRRRFVIGQEKLRIQGIFDEDLRDIGSFPQLLLGDLAGNAFTTTVCLVNLVSVASVAARAKQAASAYAALPAPANGLPAPEAQDDVNDDEGAAGSSRSGNTKKRQRVS